jgi:hypothetical protein
MNITSVKNLNMTSDFISSHAYKCMTDETIHHYLKSTYTNLNTTGYELKATSVKVDSGLSTFTGSVSVSGSLGVASILGAAGGVMTPFICAGSGTYFPCGAGGSVSSALTSSVTSGANAGVSSAGSVKGSNAKSSAKDAKDIGDKSTLMPWADVDAISEQVSKVNNNDRINNDTTTYKV